MWINFVECPDAVPVTSNDAFRLKMLQYLRDQPTFSGLLRYMPEGSLIRIHVSNEGVHLNALNAPKTADLFPVGADFSIDLGEGPIHAVAAYRAGRPYRDWAKRAVMFMFAEKDTGLMARKGTTKLVILDLVQLNDLADTSRFTLSASFPLSTADVQRLTD